MHSYMLCLQVLNICPVSKTVFVMGIWVIRTLAPIIVTTTFYTSVHDIRFLLALEMIRLACSAGYKVIVVDGSPESWVQAALQQCGAVVLREIPGKGMGASRRQAIQAALDDPDNTGVIIWLEPEKAPLVPLLAPVVRKITVDGIDLVVPRRESLVSYPQYQQYCELTGNHLVGNCTGRPELDLWFGPRAMNRRVAQLFTDYGGEYGDRWDSIFIPVARAIAMSQPQPLQSPEQPIKVASVVVSYQHPPQQTAAETNDMTMNRKRDQQLNELVGAMRAECLKLGLPKK